MDSKNITFIALMGALGNILFALSNFVVQIVPSAVSLDLSHIPTFIASIYGGPIIGFITGLITGIFPGVQYGPLSPYGTYIALIMLPIGKSLTGFFSGLLSKALNINFRKNKSLIIIPLVLLSYIPEFLFTIFYFLVILPVFFGSGGLPLLFIIIPKAWSEIIFIGFFMAALVGNNGFNNFISNFFIKPKGVK
jgi:uncharacterized membrane protein